MTLSRRHLLTFAAGAAAGAAMPAAAVARSVTIGSGVAQLGYAAALDARPLMPVDFSKRVMGRALREQGMAFEEITGGRSMDDVEWFQLRGKPAVAFDPVRHPEGRDDPTEYA